MRYGVLALALIGILSGCSGEKDASNDNFKKAAQVYFDSQKPDCYFLSYFPIETKQYNKELQRQLELLEKAKMLKLNNQAKIVEHSMFGDTKEKVAPGYELTDEGKKFFREGVETQIGGGSLGGFCFGKKEVVEVSNFSEPTNDGMGKTVALVNFTYKITHLPDWSQNPDFYSAFTHNGFRFKNLKEAVESEKAPIKARSAFILTDKGWMHADQFRNQ